MRTNLACSCVLLVVGCTRINPAFGVEDGTAGETSTSTTGVETEESGESGALLECDLDNPGEDLLVTLPFPCGEETYEVSMVVEEVLDANTLSVRRCIDPTCELFNQQGCPDTEESDLIVDPVPIGDSVGMGSCIRVAARRRPAMGEQCDYHTIALWEYESSGQGGGFEPVLIARGVADVDMPTSGADLPPTPNVSVTTKIDLSCPCGEYDCCGGDMPTTLEYFEIAGEAVDVGQEPVAVSVGDLDMDFYGLNAWKPGSCESERFDLSWALLRR